MFNTLLTGRLFNALLEGEAPSGGSGFSIDTFLGNSENLAKSVVSFIIVIAGVILVGAGIVQIAKGLASGGKGQVNWVMSILCLLVGGALMAGGFAFVKQIASGGKNEIEKMGTASASYQEAPTLAATVGGGKYIVNFD